MSDKQIVRVRIIFLSILQKQPAKLLLMLILITNGLKSQESDVDTRLKNGELTMTFPSIYFKHNSTDYALMPYTVDSCFKFIATNIKVLNSYFIWRDSSETELLTNKRIKKLHDDLNKYTSTRKISFKTAGNKQKISRQTINKDLNGEKKQYLLSLNSVLDVSGAIHPKKKWTRRTHYEGRYLCFGCWRRGAFTRDYQRLHGRKKSD